MACIPQSPSYPTQSHTRTYAAHQPHNANSSIPFTMAQFKYSPPRTPRSRPVVGRSRNGASTAILTMAAFSFYLRFLHLPRCAWDVQTTLGPGIPLGNGHQTYTSSASKAIRMGPER